MDPFAAGALTLEHSEAWAVLLVIEWPPADAVDSLVLPRRLGQVRDPRLFLHLVF